MKYITGGVCAANGFKAGGLHCGLKGSGKMDLAMIVSEATATAAATYTRNVVQAAHIHVTRGRLEEGTLRGVVMNSGNANACAQDDLENALEMCAAAAGALGVPAKSVTVASTGLIGQSMTPKMADVKKGISALCPILSENGSGDAARAIMTTDTVEKEAAVSIELDGKTVNIGAIAKGSGMIHPNMGTMLVFITTDAAIGGAALKSALTSVVGASFNRVSVDGDTSTNDMCLIMANGMAGNSEIAERTADYEIFREALLGLCIRLSRSIAADGEGASHLITCRVRNAESEEAAEATSKAVISSSLVKSAIFGNDANWGRVLCAMGYSGAAFDPRMVSFSFRSENGSVAVCENGRGLDFDEELASRVLAAHEVIIDIDMGSGMAECTCWGCDLTHDYVKINAEYRT